MRLLGRIVSSSSEVLPLFMTEISNEGEDTEQREILRLHEENIVLVSSIEDTRKQLNRAVSTEKRALSAESHRRYSTKKMLKDAHLQLESLSQEEKRVKSRVKRVMDMNYSKKLVHDNRVKMKKLRELESNCKKLRVKEIRAGNALTRLCFVGEPPDLIKKTNELLIKRANLATLVTTLEETIKHNNTSKAMLKRIQQETLKKIHKLDTKSLVNSAKQGNNVKLYNNLTEHKEILITQHDNTITSLSIKKRELKEELNNLLLLRSQLESSHSSRPENTVSSTEILSLAASPRNRTGLQIQTTSTEIL